MTALRDLWDALPLGGVFTFTASGVEGLRVKVNDEHYAICETGQVYPFAIQDEPTPFPPSIYRVPRG
jgi:hypothetical protein